MPKFFIRDALPADFAAIHRLNQSEVPHVGTLTLEQLQTLTEQSVRFRVVEDPNQVIAGFILAMDEHSSYRSLNYLWFKDRYAKFIYVDRIAVDANHRKQGLGRKLYADIENWMRGKRPVLGCEVNLLPPNPASMEFHARVGFHQAGMQESENGTKAVAMLVKDIDETLGRELDSKRTLKGN